MLAALGDPQLRVPAVLVGGSNGKGSTSALLAAMGSAAGYRTALYTSPHLESVTERLRLDGEAVDPAELARLLERVVAAAERETGSPPTYFEALTAAAFLWFAEQRAELAVVEVGMGGRLDATNLCDPLLSLITSISLEHREHLGDTLAAIAREKAGIFRPGRPALVWIEDPEPAAAVRAAAAVLGTHLRFAPELVDVRATARSGHGPGQGQQVELATPGGSYRLRLGLAGRHQANNLALAVLAAEALAGVGFPRLDRRAVTAGAAACRWPGRLERVELPGVGGAVLLDAAHNPEGAAALAEHLGQAEGPVELLFGVLADKEAEAMLSLLAPRARRIVLTAPSSPRARRPQDLAGLLADRPGVEVEPDPGRALARAMPEAGVTLVVCGSIYLIGEIRGRLRERFGVPAPAAGRPAYISGS